MNIAIYPRKSKFSPTSESIANQVAMCREYCDRCFDDPHYLVYDEDEGFSGKSTNRPAYTQMIEDMRSGKFQVLCCYRLDRISRNVRDFAELLDDLQRHNIAFVSVRNNFDTSTPFGRAMVYISSALAQMERETLAERVKDNLYEMARSGRWLGGVTPLGFVAKAQEVHRDDKKRKLLMLSPVEEELAQVRDLFDHLLRLGSVTKLLQYCLEHRIVSRNGNDYSRTTLRLLLTNPVYCTADAEAWAYFSSGDYQLCAQREDFDGVRGIQPFARTRKDDGGTVSRPTSDWIIAPGLHRGILPGAIWVRAQQILQDNRDLGSAYKAPRTENALLSGIIRCAGCGAYMRPKAYGKPLPDGKRRFSYVCLTKIDSCGARCAMPNAPGRDVDALVIKELTSLTSDGGAISTLRSEARLAQGEARRTHAEAVATHEKAIASMQKKVDKLVDALAAGAPEGARQRILCEIDRYEQEIEQHRDALSELNASVLLDADPSALLDAAFSALESFRTSFASLTHDEQRRAIRALVDRVTWDGKNVSIEVFGEKTLPK